MEGLQAFKKNLKRVKAERKHLGDTFETKIHEHCKSICQPPKKVSKPRMDPQQQEEVSSRLKLLESINDMSSDSEMSDIDGEDDTGKGDNGSNNNDDGNGRSNNDDDGKDSEDGGECERDGDTVGGLIHDDDNSDDKDEEPRHVFTQRRKRQRITSCKV